MSPPTLSELRRELRALAEPDRAEVLERYFRTGPGAYGERDRFLGARVPGIRKLARSYRALERTPLLELLRSPWHEERLLALLIMVERYRGGSGAERETIHRDYLSNTRYVDNWDLVDSSAEHILGAHLDPGRIDVLESLARSSSPWERRMAIMATFHWIRRGTFGPTLVIALRLLEDPHDLVRKAVGWMLREVGKRDRSREEKFLRQHYRDMPRVTLRYALEHFPEADRRPYLRGTA